MKLKDKIFGSYVILILIFIVAYVGSANCVKQLETARYNEGVAYYENGDYFSAMAIFKSLEGWGRKSFIDRLPEEYYALCIEKIQENYSDILICPHCGEILDS